jgi:hypothetical protein
MPLRVSLEALARDGPSQLIAPSGDGSWQHNKYRPGSGAALSTIATAQTRVTS